MSNSCIFCNKPLINENKTVEHIIPACIGGKLKSNEIICRKCNSNFGTKLDDEIFKRYKIIDYCLKLKGKGKVPKVNALYKGEEFVFTYNGPKRKHPKVVSRVGNAVTLSFPSEKAARKYYRKKKKKNPNLDVDEVIKSAKRTKETLIEPFYIKSEEINEEFWRSCGKIVYEFIFDIKRSYQPSDTLFRDFILGKIPIEKYPICFGSLDYVPIKKEPYKLYHIIVVEGRSNENIILGYLEVYGCFKTVMLIEKNYSGESFLNGYYHDLMSNQYDYFVPLQNIPIRKSELIQLINNCDSSKFIKKYINSFIKSLYNVRLFPFKKKLEDLKSQLKLDEDDLNLQKVKYFFKSLKAEFISYGLELSYLENIEEQTEEATIVQKITLMLDYLRKQFNFGKMDFHFITKIMNIFQKKGKKFKIS